MGNVNGREYEDDTSSATEEEEEEEDEDGVIVHEGFAAPDGAHSPTATRSPLIFTPQVPLVPLRPDSINDSQMQNAFSNEEICNDLGIPTIITWSYGGQEVAVEGSWDHWKTRLPLQRSGKDFAIMKVLPSGVYQYRFVVDGQWRYVPELPWADDDAGNSYNLLDLQDTVPEDIESISSFEPLKSPDSSYDSLLPGTDDYAKEPPLVPPHLQWTVLNCPLASDMEIPAALARPRHVILNHLYMQRGKNGSSVVALGTTHRFRAKYVTVVLYKTSQS